MHQAANSTSMWEHHHVSLHRLHTPGIQTPNLLPTRCVVCCLPAFKVIIQVHQKCQPAPAVTKCIIQILAISIQAGPRPGTIYMRSVDIACAYIGNSSAVRSDSS
eukprot:GHUV01015608.1.p1 GENE.GHUV01015608.1~~GHUV01015608.1.p1  ORF type:complete len:105 (-),score=9.28 GHUV01015608.1:159-473(-)